MKTRTGVFTIIVVVCFVSAAFAAPQKVNFQGKLTNAAGAPVNGSVSMTFRIYDVASGGTALWTETQTVTVTNGIYNVLLGTNNPIDTELTETKPYWLGVKVGADAEMSPRVELTPGPYSLILMNAMTIKDGNIGFGIDNPSSKFHFYLPEADGDAGSMVIGNYDGTQKNFRLLPKYSGDGYSYIQIGASTTDADAKLRISRFGTQDNLSDVRISTNNFQVNIPSNNGTGYYGTVLFGPSDESGGHFNFVNKYSDGYNYLQVGVSATDLNAKLRISRFSTLDNIAEFRVSADHSIFDGTLYVQGNDLAEPFDMTDIESLELGDVVVIDPHNPLHVTKSTTAYDTTVAGIVSSTTQAGYVAGSRSDGSSDKPIALVGRVLCNVSTENGAIKIGDLLTTSNMPGYAMKATNFEKRQGAVLGKALQAFEGDIGQILVLVTLQ